MSTITLYCNLLKEPIKYFAVTVIDLKRRLKEEMRWSVTNISINNGSVKLAYTGDTYLMDGDVVKVEARKL